MVIPVMDHIDSFFATAATTAASDEDDDEDKDTSTGEPLPNPMSASTRQPGVSSLYTTATSAHSLSLGTKPPARHSGPSTATKPSAHHPRASITTTTTSSSSSTAFLSSKATTATSSSALHAAATSNPSETADPPPPAYHKAIRAAMTVGKKTLNCYYAKTDDATLYRIAMGMFIPLLT
jgi:hypothetical protein